MFRIDDTCFTLFPVASDVKAEWLNAVQENLCVVIEDALGKGKIPKEKEYTKDNYKLLLEAIKKLVNDRVEKESKEIKETKDLIAKMSSLVERQGDRITSLENKISSLEGELAINKEKWKTLESRIVVNPNKAVGVPDVIIKGSHLSIESLDFRVKGYVKVYDSVIAKRRISSEEGFFSSKSDKIQKVEPSYFDF